MSQRSKNETDTSRLRQALGTGDRRSKGGADEVAAEASGQPRLISALVRLALRDDLVRSIRAWDALEKATRADAAPLGPFARELLHVGGATPASEVRWHVAQLIPRIVRVRAAEAEAIGLLLRLLDDDGVLVRVEAMSSLVDLADDRVDLRPPALVAVERALREGRPAEKARARRLTKRIDAWGPPGRRTPAR